MESTGRLESSGHAIQGRWLAIAIAFVLLSGMVAAPASQAQDATEAPETPDVVIPGTGDESDTASPEAPAEDEVTPESTEEPSATAEAPEEAEPSSSGTVIQLSPSDVGNPAVIAHGLALLTDDQVVWQVREVEPDGSAGAAAVVSNAAIVYQAQGSSIIRNEVTGKRALLNTGEAYFKSGGDAYTTFADSGDSVIWVFEVVGPNDVADDAFYESPLIDDYQEGVFDLLLVRYVLEAGETATLPDHTGPALVMSTNGDIDVESGGLGLLATADGQLIIEDATVTNNSSETADFVMAAFGSEVADDTSGPGAGDATTEDPASDDTTTDDETATEEPADDTTTEDDTADDTDDTTTDDSAGGTQTTINITAQSELYVVVVADGVTVFDGPIPDGGQSGEIAGTNFEVYTSYGAATLFTNACGEEFYMGYEEGEAQYTLTAEPC